MCIRDRTTIVTSSFFPGAVSRTFFTESLICLEAPCLSLNFPEDSITISTSSFFQGIFEGSFSLKHLIFLSPMYKKSLSHSISLLVVTFIASCSTPLVLKQVGLVSARLIVPQKLQISTVKV